MPVLLQKLGTLIAAGFVAVASFFVPSVHDANLGVAPANFNPVQAAPTTLSGAGAGSSDTSINLTALKTRSGALITTANIGSIGFATIDQGTSKEENISFTGVTQNGNGTAQLTGVIRGLLPVYPYTASTTLAVAHSGGASVVLSNSAAFYAQFNIAANTSTITGAWNFTTIPTEPSSTSFTGANQIVNKAYVDSVATSGAPDAGIGSKGLVAITSPLGAPTSTDGSSVLYNQIGTQFFSQTSTATATIPITNGSGTIPTPFIGQSAADNYTFLGGVAMASATFTGTTTFPNATSSVLVTNASGTLSATGVPANGTGTIVSYKNGAWSNGIYQTYATSSFLFSGNTSTVQNVATFTLPVATANSVYDIFVYYIGNSGDSNTTTTIKIGNQQIAQCFVNTQGSAIRFYAKMIMQNNASVGSLFSTVQSAGGNCATTNVTNLSPITITSTSSVEVTALTNTGAPATVVASSSITFMQ